jgi:hypothetical protein
MKTLTISSESYNVCYISHLNRNQTWLSMGVEAGRRDAIETRFWAKVNKNGANGCWLWTASAIGKAQHGQFTFRIPGRQVHVYAHRVSYELAFGPIENGLNVCHHCDVPRCVNPDHLFLGTQSDNLADARRKGRLDETLPRTKKLSLADRLTIQASPETGVMLAARYGVTPACISRVRRGLFVGAVRPNNHRDAELVFERVAHVRLPVRGDLHVDGQCG